MATTLGKVFVTADCPEFLERQIDAAKQFMDVARVNVADLRDERTKRQMAYDTAPFDPDGRALRLFPGGITIWSGFPGHGKTTLLRQLVVHLLARKRGVFFASLEEYPSDVFADLCVTALGDENPSLDGMQWCADMWGESLKIWHGVDAAEHAKMLAAIRVLGRSGVRHAIIDSMMCLDVHNSDWEAQRQFANALRTTSRSSGVHLHLVAHPRKLISSDQKPDLNDVAGARELGGIADNVLFVRRDVAESGANASVTTMKISVLKQRHYRGKLGVVSGWFNIDLRQFKLDQFDAKPTRYLPDEAYARSAKIEELPI